MLSLEYLVVIGCSAGGVSALKSLLAEWPVEINASLVIVQHMSSHSHHLASLLNHYTVWPVTEANDKESIEANHVYIAPADYHLLIEQDMTLSLSRDEKVLFTRPAIDVLMKSAAEVFRKHLIAVILTGANEDGTEGCRWVKKHGGTTIAQDPNQAETNVMPLSAINAGVIDYVGTLSEIAHHIATFHKSPKKENP